MQSSPHLGSRQRLSDLASYLQRRANIDECAPYICQPFEEPSCSADRGTAGITFFQYHPKFGARADSRVSFLHSEGVNGASTHASPCPHSSAAIVHEFLSASDVQNLIFEKYKPAHERCARRSKRGESTGQVVNGRRGQDEVVGGERDGPRAQTSAKSYLVGTLSHLVWRRPGASRAFWTYLKRHPCFCNCQRLLGPQLPTLPRWFRQPDQRDENVEAQAEELVRLQRIFAAATGLGAPVTTLVEVDQGVQLSSLRSPTDVILCPEAMEILGKPVKARGKEAGVAASDPYCHSGVHFQSLLQVWEGRGEDFEEDFRCVLLFCLVAG